MSLFPQVKNLLQPIASEPVKTSFGSFETVGYSFLFLIAVFLGRYMIEKFEEDIDTLFYIEWTPVIIFSGILSSIAFKLNIRPYLFFPALGIFVLIFYSLSKTLKHFKKTDINYLIFSIGLVGIFSTLIYFKIPKIDILIYLLFNIIFWTFPIFLILKKWEKFREIGIWAPVSSHLLDASSTVTAVTFGAEEKVFFSRYVIETVGKWGIFPLKLMIVLPAVFYINRSDISERRKNYYLFIIYALGLALFAHNLSGLFMAQSQSWILF